MVLWPQEGQTWFSAPSLINLILSILCLINLMHVGGGGGRASASPASELPSHCCDRIMSGHVTPPSSCPPPSTQLGGGGEFRRSVVLGRSTCVPWYFWALHTPHSPSKFAPATVGLVSRGVIIVLAFGEFILASNLYFLSCRAIITPREEDTISNIPFLPLVFYSSFLLP